MGHPPVIDALVIDDDEFVLRVIVKQLKSLGASDVLTASGWNDARSLLDRNARCNVVISDLDMPGASGSNFLEELAHARPGMALIIVSAMGHHVLDAAEKEARKLPLRVLGCIPKPAGIEALRNLLNSLDPR